MSLIQNYRAQFHSFAIRRVKSWIEAMKSNAVADAMVCSKRSEEHTSELQSLMRISYAVVCLKKKKKIITNVHNVKHITLNKYSENLSHIHKCVTNHRQNIQ